MDLYRASEVYHSPINRSFVSQSRVRSTIESTLDYKNSQVSLSKIMKYLFMILAAAIALLVLYSFIDKPKTVVERVDKTGWSLYDNVKYNLFDIRPDNKNIRVDENMRSNTSRTETGFMENIRELWPGDKGCGNIKELEQKLRSQRYSVQKHLDHLPSLDDIRANRDKYDLSNELSRSCREGDLDFKSSIFTNIMSNFDRLIGVGILTPKSTQDDFSAINAQLHTEQDRYKYAERLLDNEFIYSVKGDVNDLVHSHKNLQEKKVLLNGYRYSLFNHMRQLETVINDIKNAKADLDSEKASEIQLNSRLGEAEALVNKFNRMMNEKEGTMGDRQQKELSELRAIDDRIDEVKASIVNADKIRNELRNRRERILKTQHNASSIGNDIAELDREVSRLQAERKNKADTIKSIQDTSEMYENRKRIHMIKLEVFLRNKEIKAFLDKLINSNTNMDNLTTLINSKITDEEKLMLLMKQYNEESEKLDQMEGRTIIDTERVTSDTLKTKIEKDRQDFKKIMEKYLGLKKVVEEYEDTDFEINNLKIKIQEIDDKNKHTAGEKARIQADIDKLDKQITNIDDKLRVLKDKNNVYKTQIEQDEQYIGGKENQIVDSERQLADLQAQKAVLDVKYKAR